MRLTLLILLLAAGALAQPMPLVLPPPGNARVSWNPSPASGIVEYSVYYGPGSRAYTNRVDVGNVTNATLRLPKGTSYIAATATDFLGNESQFSNEVSYTLPASKTNAVITISVVTSPNPNGPWTDLMVLFKGTNPPGSKFFDLAYRREMQ